MDNRELDERIEWCRKKIAFEKNKKYGLTGKKLEGYEMAMLATMSYLSRLKEKSK